MAGGSTGALALDRDPAPGDWRAVVMNADESRGITAELEFGARTSLLWWVGAALLGAGVLGAAAGNDRSGARGLRADSSGRMPLTDETSTSRAAIWPPLANC